MRALSEVGEGLAPALAFAQSAWSADPTTGVEAGWAGRTGPSGAREDVDAVSVAVAATGSIKMPSLG
jgi:hypothetical protein